MFLTMHLKPCLWHVDIKTENVWLTVLRIPLGRRNTGCWSERSTVGEHVCKKMEETGAEEGLLLTYSLPPPDIASFWCRILGMRLLTIQLVGGASISTCFQYQTTNCSIATENNSRARKQLSNIEFALQTLEHKKFIFGQLMQFPALNFRLDYFQFYFSFSNISYFFCSHEIFKLPLHL